MWFDTVIYVTSVTLAVGKINTYKKALRSWKEQRMPQAHVEGHSLAVDTISLQVLPHEFITDSPPPPPWLSNHRIACAPPAAFSHEFVL